MQMPWLMKPPKQTVLQTGGCQENGAKNLVKTRNSEGSARRPDSVGVFYQKPAVPVGVLDVCSCSRALEQHGVVEPETTEPKGSTFQPCPGEAFWPLPRGAGTV